MRRLQQWLQARKARDRFDLVCLGLDGRQSDFVCQVELAVYLTQRMKSLQKIKNRHRWVGKMHHMSAF